MVKQEDQAAFKTKAESLHYWYKRAGRDKDRQRYRKLLKSTQQECKSAYNTYVSDMVQEDGNSKELYSFIKSKQCWDCPPPPRSDWNLHGDLQTNASFLNQQFSSVFTTEDMSNIPDLGTSTIPLAPDIRVTENGVLTLLSNLNPNKATGPDEISTKIPERDGSCSYTSTNKNLPGIQWQKPNIRRLEDSQRITYFQKGRRASLQIIVLWPLRAVKWWSISFTAT